MSTSQGFYSQQFFPSFLLLLLKCIKELKFLKKYVQVQYDIYKVNDIQEY